MSIISAKPTTRRGYVSKEEVADTLGIEVATVDIKKLSVAEELIDNYVGFVKKFWEGKLNGKASDVGANSISLQADQKQIYDVDYFVGCEVEIIGGAGAGQRRKVTSSNKAGILIVDTNWTTNLDTSSYYEIYQLGKFPRKQDVTFDSVNDPATYYKRIPEAIKRATVAQYEYMVELGDSFFAGGGDNKISESIGDYSYTLANGDIGTDDLVSTKVKAILGGYVSRVGKIVV